MSETQKGLQPAGHAQTRQRSQAGKAGRDGAAELVAAQVTARNGEDGESQPERERAAQSAAHAQQHQPGQAAQANRDCADEIFVVESAAWRDGMLSAETQRRDSAARQQSASPAEGMRTHS